MADDTPSVDAMPVGQAGAARPERRASGEPPRPRQAPRRRTAPATSNETIDPAELAARRKMAAGMLDAVVPLPARTVAAAQVETGARQHDPGSDPQTTPRALALFSPSFARDTTGSREDPNELRHGRVHEFPCEIGAG